MLHPSSKSAQKGWNLWPQNSAMRAAITRSEIWLYLMVHVSPIGQTICENLELCVLVEGVKLIRHFH